MNRDVLLKTAGLGMNYGKFAALSGVNGVLVSPGCVSLGTQIFIASKNVARNVSERAPEGTQKLLFLRWNGRL